MYPSSASALRKRAEESVCDSTDIQLQFICHSNTKKHFEQLELLQNHFDEINLFHNVKAYHYSKMAFILLRLTRASKNC